MLEWITENRELLIALFGAGGAGAILLTRLLSGKKSPSAEKPKAEPAPSGISATASDRGVAVAHAGHGDVTVGINQDVNQDTVRAAQERMSLSLSEAARFLKICDAAGLSTSDLDKLLQKLGDESTEGTALAEAVRAGEEAEAQRLILRLLDREPPPQPRAD